MAAFFTFFVATTYANGWAGTNGPKSPDSAAMLWSDSTRTLYSVTSSAFPVVTFSASTDAGDNWSDLSFGTATELLGLDDATSPPTFLLSDVTHEVQLVQDGLAIGAVDGATGPLTVDASVAPHRLFAIGGGSVTTASESGGYFGAVAGAGLSGTITAIAIDNRAAPTTVFAVNDSGAIFSAQVGDAVWQSVSAPGAVLTQLFVDTSTTPSTLLGSDGNTLYAMPVGGAWSTLASNIAGASVVMSSAHRFYIAAPSYGVKSIAVGEADWTTLPMGPFAQAGSLILDDSGSVPRFFIDATSIGFRASATDSAWQSFAGPLVVMPVTPTAKLSSGPERGVYAMTASDGVWRYDGSEWSRVGDPSQFVCQSANNAAVVQLTYVSALYASNDSACVFSLAGESWSPTSPAPSTLDGFAVDATFSPPHLYAASASAGATYAYDGSTWSTLSAPAPHSGRSVMLVDDSTSQPGALYVANDAGVSVSPNAGASFTAVSGAPANVAHLRIDHTTNPHTLVAIVATTFLGTLWAGPVGGALSPLDATLFQPLSFAIDEHTSPSTWYRVDALDQLYASVDHGATWSALGEGYVFDLVVDSAAEPHVLFGESIDTLARAATPLRIDAIEPSAAAAGTSAAVTLHGDGFFDGVQILWGGSPLPVTFIDAHTLSVTAPAHAAGTVDVSLLEPLLPALVLPDEFSYLAPAPVLASLAPQQAAAGTALTLTGANFLSGATVAIGDVPATVTALTATTVSVTAPAHADGTVDIVISNPDGQSARLVNGFTYVAAAVAAPSPPTPPAIAAATKASAHHCSGTGEPLWMLVTAVVYARGKRRR